MKKLILSILIIIVFCYVAIAQNVNIPDANFKACLIGNAAINTNGDAEIQVSEANAFSGTIDCSSSNISDLTGIETFINLTELNCRSNQLTSINLTQNTALIRLLCFNNQLTNLDITQNTALTALYCYNNPLTSLNVTQNTALEVLWCYNNQLTELDVTQNTALKDLRCYDNQLTELDVTQNTVLEELRCSNNQLTTLDITQSESLIALGCGNNELTSLNAATGGSPSNFYIFYTIGNPNLFCIVVDSPYYSTIEWTNIDTWTSFSTNCTVGNVNIPDANFKACLVGDATINTNGDTEIQISEAAAYSLPLNCSSMGIADLTGIEAFTILTQLYCNDNLLTSLDVTQNTRLGFLSCYQNQLTSLDVTQNTSLMSLTCFDNQLTSLDVTQNPELNELSCFMNQLTSLDVTQNSGLELLYCSDNQLTSLDVTQNPELDMLYCDNNQLISLDVTQNPELYWFYCNNNQLTNLNMASGNNTNISDFDASNNPNLTCIEVDDVAYSTNNWTNIDTWTNFSTNCTISNENVNIPDANFKACLVGNIAINTNGDAEIQVLEASSFTGDIDCFNSNISDLTGIEAFTALTGLFCDDNLLTSLDVTQNTALQVFWCFNNQLTELNMANGNNTIITDFDATNNPNLTCIEVDDVAYSTANWTYIDAWASFSTNCALGINQFSIKNIRIYPNPVKNQLTIYNIQSLIYNATIIDITGKIVKTVVSPNNTIDVSELTNGIYFLQIKTENGIISNKKFIKNP